MIVQGIHSYITPGGGGIDMGWLDGMTNCPGDCNIDGSSVSFSNFALKDGKNG